MLTGLGSVVRQALIDGEFKFPSFRVAGQFAGQFIAIGGKLPV
jgi:hypothetical protein